MYNVYGFGKRIAACRKMLGFTQEELAVKLNITAQTGKLDFFEAAISGSGAVDASNISTKNANISIDGAGDVIIGWVMEESVEKHSR